MFSKNIRTLYLYIVSFLALMAIIYSSVALVEKITNYFYPVAYYETYNSYNTYDIDEKYTTQGEYNTISARDTIKKNAQIQTIKDVFTDLAILLVATFIYSYHWKMVQRENNMEGV